MAKKITRRKKATKRSGFKPKKRTAAKRANPRRSHRGKVKARIYGSSLDGNTKRKAYKKIIWVKDRAEANERAQALSDKLGRPLWVVTDKTKDEKTGGWLKRLFSRNPSAKPRHKTTKRSSARKRKPTPRHRLTGKVARRAGSKRKRNGAPSDAVKSQAIYQKFHGKKSTGHSTVMVRRHIPTDVAELGKLVELVIKPVGGGAAVIAKPSGVTVACSPNGNQIYFLGGDQVPRLSDYGIAAKSHELEELGTLTKLVYFTKKGFHNFAPTEYSHRMGEDGGQAPAICFNVLEKVLYLNGGTYQVKPEGIVH